MVKKWLWITPLTIGITASVTGAVVGGCLANQNANPYREYYSTPVGYSNSDLMQVYLASIVNGTRLLLLPGYIQNSPLTQALALTPKTNDLMYNYMNKSGFILLDDSYGLPIFKGNQIDNSIAQPVWSSQVASVNFRADLGSFITGIAAAEFLNEYQYYFAPNENDELTWATYGGATYDTVISFMGGLQKGIRWFNDNIANKGFKTQDGRTYKPVRQVFVGSEQNSNFVNGFGLTDGNQLINLFLDQKVDLLIPVAGSQTQQAVRLIRQKGTRTVVLGVDTAGEDDTNTNLPLTTNGYKTINGSEAIGGTNKVIQFSSVKKLDQAGKQIMEKINEGQSLPSEGSTIGGFGYQSLGTTENGCVGVSEAGYSYFVKAISLWQSSNKTSNEQEIFNQINSLSKSELADAYEKAVQYIGEQKFFKNLNEPSQKVYYATDNWELNQPADDKSSWSYSKLPNEGKRMMPLNESELDKWFKEDYLGLKENESLSNDQKEQLQSLHNWFAQNQSIINIRKSFSLENQLTKENFESNPSIAKVVVNTPDTPLLDKGFCQSAYLGLVEYWKTKTVSLPLPTK